MSREVCEVVYRGRTFKIASLTYREAKKWTEEGRELLKSEQTTNTWLARRDQIVVDMLNAGEGENCSTWNIESLGDLSIPTIDFLYGEILGFAGLKPGEAQAVSASPKSEAA